MRRRLPVAAASAALAATLLTACHSNVGTAATVNGHRITESDVAKYVTANAQPIPESDQTTGQTTNVPPRSFVLTVLLDSRLFEQVLREVRTEANRAYPSQSEVSAAENTFLSGASVRQLEQGVMKSGLTAAFADLYLKERGLEELLGTEAKGGADINTVVAKLHAKVSVNPRYGVWDPKTFTLNSTSKDGLPSFLHANATYTAPAPSAARSGTG